jgi:hypothetical protein
MCELLEGVARAHARNKHSERDWVEVLKREGVVGGEDHLQKEKGFREGRKNPSKGKSYEVLDAEQ